MAAAAPSVDRIGLERGVCQHSFEQFVHRFWQEVPGAGKLVWNWHMSVLCLPYEAEIITSEGSKRIGEIVDCGWVGDVLSWNHDSHVCEWKPIKKWMKNPGTKLVRIDTKEGDNLQLTANHPVFVVGRGYVEAGEVRVGDHVRKLRPTVAQGSSILQQGLSLHPPKKRNQKKAIGPVQTMREPVLPLPFSTSPGAVLQPGLHGDFQEEAPGFLFDLQRRMRQQGGAMPEVLESSHERKENRQVASLSKLQEIGLSSARHRGAKKVRGLLRFQVLRGVRERRKQSSVYRWGGPDTVPKGISQEKEIGDGKGWPSLLPLRINNQHRNTPRGSKQVEQPIVESGDFVQEVPLQAKGGGSVPFETIESTVSSIVEVLRIPDQVYNLEIEGNHNYFANGILVHNCDELQNMAERVFVGLPRLYDEIFNVSPGTSKSTLSSILFPCWAWTRMPSCRILSASHTADLVLDLSNKSRWVIRCEKYRALFPEIELRADQDTKSYYANTLGGDRYTCTVAGKSPMGMHAHIQIIDDPIDPKKASSQAELKTAKEFFDAVLPGRKVNKDVTAMFLIMQRLHFEDPTGHLLNKAKQEGSSKVRHICLPAELPKGSDGAYGIGNVAPQELAKRYVDGMMDPVRLSRKILNERRSDGMYAYAGQYGQNPVPLAGGMFKDTYFNNRCRASPYHAKRVFYVDRAATQDGGCATAGVLMSRSGEGNLYVEDVLWGQWEPYERNQRLKAAALKYRARYGPRNEPTIWIEREGGASGRDSLMDVVRVLAGFNVREHNVSRAGSKIVRAEPWSSQCAAGLVWLVDDGTWDVNGFIKEHCSFPLGAFLDRVDASSGAFSRLVAGIAGQGGFRVLTSRLKQQAGLRIMVMSRDDLATTTIEQRAILFLIEDPEIGGNNHEPTDGVHARDQPVGSVLSLHDGAREPDGQSAIPNHGFARCLEAVRLRFADLLPAEHQDRWNDPLEPWGRPPAELAMSRDDGKRVWSAVLRKRPQPFEVLAFADAGNGDRRAASVAMAVCDALRLDRKCMFLAADPEARADGEPPNGHCFDVTKLARGLVL